MVMDHSRKGFVRLLLALIISLVGMSCMLLGPENAGPTTNPSPVEPQLSPAISLTPSLMPTATPVGATPAGDWKWSLWTGGTQLRGANIYQRRVFPEMDGTEFYGPGPFGPPYTQADLDRLAALGANYVNISTAGLFTVQPPYRLDEEALANLDRLLEMVAAADMFAVITFRTGPGRSEFAIIGGGGWPAESYIVNTVWTDESAREAWAAMWGFAAERYRDDPIVIGYDLMCEPNSNAVLDIWDAETFYSQYAGTGYDWNAWYPHLVRAIRGVDAFTPILVGGNSFSGAEWIPYLQPVDDPYVVYTFHQYSPHEYTHQAPPDPMRTYPGYFDIDYDGDPETFDGAWLESLLSSAVDFSAKYHVPVAVNEFGAERWVSGAADYVRDEMDLFEGYGWNYAVWQWQPAWLPLTEGDTSFNFRFGMDPNNITDMENALFSAYIEAWARNLIRLSNFGN